MLQNGNQKKVQKNIRISFGMLLNVQISDMFAGGASVLLDSSALVTAGRTAEQLKQQQAVRGAATKIGSGFNSSIN